MRPPRAADGERGCRILKKVVDFFLNVEPIMFANLTSINYDLIDWNGLYKFIESEIKENENRR